MEHLPFHRPGRFFKGNLHTHCTRSDGDLPVEEVIRRYRSHGYDFLAMSDHFLPDYEYPVTDTRSYRSETFTTLVAAELHASKTLNDELWHVLAVGLPVDFERPRQGEGIVELASRAAGAGAFIGIVHPAWYGLQPEDARILSFAHAVEVYNHGSQIENERGDGWGLCDTLLNEGRRLHGFATDDAHHLTHDVFGGWVCVKAEALDPDLILESLKDGLFYSSQGPQIHDIRVEDDEILVDCSPAKAVVVSGRGSRGGSVFGTGLTQARFPLKRFKDSFFRITVVDTVGLKAWSNAVWT